METALQKAIKIIKALAEEEVLLIARIEALLPLDKEQIENAYNEGLRIAVSDIKKILASGENDKLPTPCNSDQYYSQTYKTE